MKTSGAYGRACFDMPKRWLHVNELHALARSHFSQTLMRSVAERGFAGLFALAEPVSAGFF
jgi:hypothetical protein